MTTKEHFIQELRKLKDKIAAQSVQVENTMVLALKAVETLDSNLAQGVIDGDNAIDEEEIVLEEECLKILALYQPVATDLRVVVAMLKINTSLERMADFGVHIARRVLSMVKCPSHPEGMKLLDFTPMAARTLSMLRAAMAIMKEGNPARAYAVIAKDEAVNEAHAENVSYIRNQIKQYPDQADFLLDCLGVSRDLERIADIATDICEHLIYVQTGRIIRHESIPGLDADA